jgi:hypothetical protein
MREEVISYFHRIIPVVLMTMLLPADDDIGSPGNSLRKKVINVD